MMASKIKMDTAAARLLIEQLESIRLKEKDAYSEIVAVFRENFGQGILFKFVMTPHPEVFYIRARKLKQKDQLIDSVSGHSYNNDPQKVPFGRANIPGQQMMYLGRDRIVTLAELNINSNSQPKQVACYSLSRWVIAKKIKVGVILDPYTYESLDSWELQGFKPYFKETLDGLVRNGGEGIIALYSYLSNKMSSVITKSAPEKYKMTSAIANFYFEMNPDIEGLVLQSVKHPEKYNLVQQDVI
jgi:hypothetical protein